MKGKVSPVPEEKEIVPCIFTLSMKKAWWDFTKLSALSRSVQWTSESQYKIINKHAIIRLLTSTIQ